jgi:gas vesicle protein
MNTIFADFNLWIMVSVAAAFLFGILIGSAIGSYRAYAKVINQQQQAEVNRVWQETFKSLIGGAK